MQKSNDCIACNNHECSATGFDGVGLSVWCFGKFSTKMCSRIFYSHLSLFKFLAFHICFHCSMVSAVVINAPRCTMKEFIQRYGIDVVAVGKQKRDACNAFPDELGILRVCDSGSAMTTEQVAS